MKHRQIRVERFPSFDRIVSVDPDDESDTIPVFDVVYSYATTERHRRSHQTVLDGVIAGANILRRATDAGKDSA